jgi:hypothetical protein
VPLYKRRRALASACRLAIDAIDDLEPEGSQLLQDIFKDNALSETQVAKAVSLAEEADDRYFCLQDEGAPIAEWRNWFRKARLFTGIAAGFGGSSWSDTSDAVYELCKVRMEVIALVE